jgi:hypothetical protein
MSVQKGLSQRTAPLGNQEPAKKTWVGPSRRFQAEGNSSGEHMAPECLKREEGRS